MACLAATRSGASLLSVELTKTRRRWSGVCIVQRLLPSASCMWIGVTAPQLCSALGLGHKATSALEMMCSLAVPRAASTLTPKQTTCAILLCELVAPIRCARSKSKGDAGRCFEGSSRPP
jgi:hypothetical protein